MSRRAILIHGYGVRGFFWDALKEELTASFERVLAPDLDMESVEQGVSTLEELLRREAAESGEPVVLVGHSLGGVISAIAAGRLGGGVVSHLVVVAAPYGRISSSLTGKLLRLAVRYRLIPGWVLRPRFFGPRVDRETQKALFSRAVPESAGLRDLAKQEQWFHTGAFDEPLEQATLVIASEGDQIVEPAATVAFGRELRAETTVFDREAGIGHNDFGYWPPAAKRTAEEILRFLERRP